jgi:anti-sigma B factor antagonist
MSEQRYRVSGELDYANADELRTQLMSIVRDTRDDLVVDCDRLSFVDETGVGVFARVSELLSRSHRGFRLANLHGNARRKIDSLGLAARFGVDDGS